MKFQMPLPTADHLWVFEAEANDVSKGASSTTAERLMAKRIVWLIQAIRERSPDGKQDAQQHVRGMCQPSCPLYQPPAPAPQRARGAIRLTYERDDGDEGSIPEGRTLAGEGPVIVVSVQYLVRADHLAELDAELPGLHEGTTEENKS